MQSKERTSRARFDPPIWDRKFRVLGVTSALYGLIRYTFVGEWLEHIFHDIVDNETAEDFANPIQSQPKDNG